MDINKFAPNLSFFFTNGLDPEYTVIGRVARRIWAVTMRDLYGADERSQKLKYHIQTSGRSLHAQEIDFNDIRTTFRHYWRFKTMQTLCTPTHTMKRLPLQPRKVSKSTRNPVDCQQGKRLDKDREPNAGFVHR